MHAQVKMDGLDWGASALEDVGYGIKKLRITCVVVDDKVRCRRPAQTLKHNNNES